MTFSKNTTSNTAKKMSSGSGQNQMNALPYSLKQSPYQQDQIQNYNKADKAPGTNQSLNHFKNQHIKKNIEGSQIDDHLSRINN